MQIAKILIALTLLFSVAAAEAEAGKKKHLHLYLRPHSAKKMHAEGLIGCRKKFGTQLHFVRVEKFYGRWAAVCYHY
jgi:hypothetical protein